MFLDEFHSVTDNRIRITARQASAFARKVAGDFNPIHDEDAKRFCVPGDLLFALVLTYYGLSTKMTFTFKGMVGDDVPLVFPRTDAATFDIGDDTGKTYLQVQRSGPSTTDAAVVEAFIRRYVAFSGDNFPNVLQPLLAEQQVMFNPDRPLIIYESMGFDLHRLDVRKLDMTLADSSLAVNGKRGDVVLDFSITADGAGIGSGSKKLVVGSLRPYDKGRMEEVIMEFNRRKRAG